MGWGLRMGFSLVVILLLLSLSKGLGGSCGWDRGLGRLSCSALTINDSRHDNLTQVLLSQFRGDVSTRTSTHETMHVQHQYNSSYLPYANSRLRRFVGLRLKEAQSKSSASRPWVPASSQPSSTSLWRGQGSSTWQILFQTKSKPSTYHTTPCRVSTSRRLRAIPVPFRTLISPTTDSPHSQIILSDSGFEGSTWSVSAIVANTRDRLEPAVFVPYK
jgi:hypothetical protein